MHVETWMWAALGLLVVVLLAGCPTVDTGNTPVAPPLCRPSLQTFKAAGGIFGPEYYTPVDLVGLYWHLVDLIWIFLFPLLYLI